MEAGLRTYQMNSPYPEEFNRQAVGLIAQLHFAPTKKAAEALHREGKDPENVFVTGNTGIDALQYTVRTDFSSPELEWAKGSRLVTVTAHRRENLGEPLDVVEFHNLMKASYLIMTDSGGIQEEAPALGKPVLVMRDTTERPEGVAAGTLKLTGTGTEAIYRECRRLLTDQELYRKMSEAKNLYGDGTASRQIREILEKS